MEEQNNTHIENRKSIKLKDISSNFKKAIKMTPLKPSEYEKKKKSVMFFEPSKEFKIPNIKKTQICMKPQIIEQQLKTDIIQGQRKKKIEKVKSDRKSESKSERKSERKSGRKSERKSERNITFRQLPQLKTKVVNINKHYFIPIITKFDPTTFISSNKNPLNPLKKKRSSFKRLNTVDKKAKNKVEFNDSNNEIKVRKKKNSGKFQLNYNNLNILNNKNSIKKSKSLNRSSIINTEVEKKESEENEDISIKKKKLNSNKNLIKIFDIKDKNEDNIDTKSIRNDNISIIDRKEEKIDIKDMKYDINSIKDRKKGKIDTKDIKYDKISIKDRKEDKIDNYNDDEEENIKDYKNEEKIENFDKKNESNEKKKKLNNEYIENDSYDEDNLTNKKVTMHNQNKSVDIMKIKRKKKYNENILKKIFCCLYG